MVVTPFMAYQAAFRFVCSLLRHHIVVIAKKVGAMQKLVRLAGCSDHTYQLKLQSNQGRIVQRKGL